MIYNLRSYSCKSCQCFFHLWGSGAPNWQREYNDWCSEQSRDWQVVSHRKTPLTGANVVPVAAGRSYAEVARDQRLDPISSDLMHVSRSPPISNGWALDRRNVPSPPRPTLLHRATDATSDPGMGRPPCSRCLAHGHARPACVSKVRCLAYYCYEHIKRNCLAQRPKAMIFRIKRKPLEITSPASDLAVPSSAVEPSSVPTPTRSPHQPPPPYHPNPHPLPMANYPCDPRPHLPPGMDFIPPCAHRRR
jgi:hypothetical protein